MQGPTTLSKASGCNYEYNEHEVHGTLLDSNAKALGRRPVAVQNRKRFFPENRAVTAREPRVMDVRPYEDSEARADSTICSRKATIQIVAAAESYM